MKQALPRGAASEDATTRTRIPQTGKKSDSARLLMLGLTRTPGGANSWLELLAVMIVLTICVGGLSFGAITLGVLADGYGFTLTDAGVVMSLELGALALGSAFGGLALRTLSVRSLAAAGGLIACAANFGTAIGAGMVGIGLLRMLVGAGTGLMSAAVNTAVSRSRNPEQLFVTSNAGIITLSSLFFFVMPMVYTRYGYPAYFVAFGIADLAAVASLVWLTVGAERISRQSGPIRPAAGYRGIGVVLTISFFWLGYSVLWSVIERLGLGTGMSDEVVGRVLSAGTLTGLLGAAVAIWLGKRVRLPWPAVVGAVGSALCYLGLTQSHSPTAYTWSLCIWGPFFCPFLPYAFSIATLVDPSGGVTRWVMSGLAVTTALAPALATHMVGSIGERGLGLAVSGGALLAAALLAAFTPRVEVDVR